MKFMITGHRREKLAGYDQMWVRATLANLVGDLADKGLLSIGLSGMASGIDLWFCQACLDNGIPYWACIPFEDQDKYMTEEDRAERGRLLWSATETRPVRNSWMVQKCDAGIVVWDGNKGGTHNCLQQLLEAGKDIWWIVPNKKKVVQV